jgi:methylated-DNA-[protein]-cysteine S-methyltransferase
MASRTIESPVGALTITEDDGAIIGLAWGRAATDAETPLLRRAARQLEAYFAGRLRHFDLPLAPQGTAHQRRVWQAMAEIPFGETESYGSMARRLGSAAQAVGQACGANPIPVIVPCHRVVAAGGLGGFSGGAGVATKEILLARETRFAAETQDPVTRRARAG